jgi:hypothetical protein
MGFVKRRHIMSPKRVSANPLLVNADACLVRPGEMNLP